MSRHYAGMTQDWLLIAVTIGGEGGVSPPTLIHPHNNLSDWSVG
jgi:hypothetical protein